MQNINLSETNKIDRPFYLQRSSIFFWVICSILFHVFFLLFCKVTYVAPLQEPLPKSRVYIFSPNNTTLDPFLTNRINFLLKYRDPIALIHPNANAKRHHSMIMIQPHLLLAKTNFPSPAPIPADKEVDFLKIKTMSLDQCAKSFPLSKERPSFGKVLPVMPKKSIVFFDDILKKRLLCSWELPKISTNLLSEARITKLVISVEPDGIVHNALLEESCGNEQADLLALSEVRKLHFAPDPLTKRTIWGKIKIFWSYSDNAQTRNEAIP
ncbi:hypothetical protein A7Q09_09320 [Methylacidiphilum sp. Yel]|uniref:hypothetical protein n=1 Tax=Methylacidiphilum sp. Yel TaxID=1847730 RepID=UPI00106AA185|nr:hypothetical protein [Methylacidiphilum sp. Yel]TFE66881.1 hypothetical protein A7Q09_09320 [Methylacidiphilum sp. Yel]